MGKQIFFLLLFLGCSFWVSSQEAQFEIKSTAYLNQIIQNRQKIKGNIYWGSTTHNLLPFSSKQISKAVQNLVISDSTVLITVDGTGLVYKLISNRANELLQFQRIDSTYYAGNTFNSLNFYFNDHLYSLGGYGFWRSNGQLRVFSPITHDWNIEPINKELTVTNNDIMSNLWFDPFNQSIFSLGYSNLNQATHINNDKLNLKLDSVYVFNLKSKSWHSLGTIHSEFQINSTECIPIINTKFGLLITNNSKIDFEIWNIPNNTIQKLTKEVQNKFPISGLDDYCFWYEEETIYFANSTNNKIDSVVISSKDLIATDKRIYNKSNAIYNTGFILLLGSIFILICLGIIYWQKNRKNKKHLPRNLKNTALKGSPRDSNNLFSAIEKALINLLINNINNGRLTSIEEVNYILGISSKSVNMQKRTRSDVINSINSKYQLSYKTDEPLILRKNSELDQRVKEFYLNQEHIDLIKKLLD